MRLRLKGAFRLKRSISGEGFRRGVWGELFSGALKKSLQEFPVLTREVFALRSSVAQDIESAAISDFVGIVWGFDREAGLSKALIVNWDRDAVVSQVAGNRFGAALT